MIFYSKSVKNYSEKKIHKVYPFFIEHIEYPPKSRLLISNFKEPILKTLNRDGIPFKTGYLDSKDLLVDDEFPFEFIKWITKNNSIIDNLNLVLTDLNTLGNNHELFEGSPVQRFYLLVRLFFY